MSEIQSSNKFVNDRLDGWAWVSTKDNPADWCTKPHPVKDLIPGGFWQSGTDFLHLHEKDWPIKLSYRTDRLEGEIVIGKRVYVAVVNVAHPDLLGRIANYCSSWKRMCRVLARIIRFGVSSSPLDSEYLQRAKKLLLKYAQNDIAKELKLAESGKGRFRRLAPILDDEGIVIR